ncbi:MAG: prepilin-type N-terminal cleavage/methylation domain-containing protein [Oscillospiraceae bacterium]
MKKFKGFTLLELIIVMAVMSILMVGIMQMMKPIRTTFVDSVYYESQRNTQNGMITYLCDKLRYANNVGIYTSGSVGNAITDFKDNVVDDTKYDTDLIHVITIDNSRDYTYNGATGFHGRIVVNKPKATGYSIADADNPSSASARVALSEAYYGDCSYCISIDPTVTGTSPNYKLESFDVTVTSLLDHGKFGATKQKNITTNTQDIASSSNQTVSTEGYVICKNMDSTKAYSGGFHYPGSVCTTTQGTKTYIVYTFPLGEDR